MGSFAPVAEELRKAALAYPGAYEERPWGELAIKVKGKIFVFLGREGLSVKLPRSNGLALSFPFAEPTHYGLGKSGWVTAHFEGDQEVPVGLLVEWIDESYRAVAPKTLVKELDGGAKPGAAAERPTKKNKTAVKPAKRGAKKATVLVVSDDELRLERARKAIAADGVGAFLGAGVDDAFELASKKKPRAAVVDLGRRPPEALELGIQLAHALGKAPIIFAGARDVATVKKARKAASSVRAAFREPPGDPRVLAELAAALE